MSPGSPGAHGAITACLTGRPLKSRWHVFSSILMAVSISGTSYAFGMFSEVFKDKLGFSQLELSVIGSCGSTGLYTGVFCGLGIERYGPRVVLFVGAWLIFSGNMYMWLAAQKLVEHSVPVLAIVNFFAQLGVACSSATTTTVSIRSFPSTVRGRVAGLAKAYFGISAAVLAAVANGFFLSASVHFILFVALLIPSFLVVGALNANATFFPANIVSFSYERSRGYPTSLNLYFQHLLMVMSLILVASAVVHFMDTSRATGYALSLTVAVAVVSVILLPSCYGPRLLPPEVQAATSAESAAARLLGEDGDDIQSEKLDAALMSERTVTVDFVSFFGRHLTVTEVMGEWRCYALMFVFCCSAGSGLLVINNIVAVTAAVGQDASSFFIVILSLANGLGRMTIGVVADVMSGRLSRIQLLAATTILMSCAQFLLSLNTSELLYPSLFMVGLAFGATFANVSAIVADLFGAQHIGSNYGFIDLSPTIGSYIFATGLIAAFYPEEDSDDSNGDDDEPSCRGAHCLQRAFFVTTAACIAASAMALLLHVKTPIHKDH